MSDDVESELRDLKQQLEESFPSTAEKGELNVVAIKIMPKEGGSGRMYALGSGGMSVYPEPEAIVEVHRACQEVFDHERLDDGTSLGYAALTGGGDLVHYDLLDPEDVEQ